MIIFYHIHQFFNVILIFFKIQDIQFTQNIVNVCHNNDNFINNFKCYDFRIQRIEIVLSHEFNSIKVKKILQVSRTLRINVQLFLLNQLDKNIFKLMIVNSHLIVDTSLVLVFL